MKVETVRRDKGFLLKKSGKENGWSRRWFVLNEKTGKLGYTKKQEERHFRAVITLEECNIEEVAAAEGVSSKSSKDKKANGPKKEPTLVFKITSRIPYKTVLKAHSAVVLKAESIADKTEWLEKLKTVFESKGENLLILKKSLSGWLKKCKVMWKQFLTALPPLFQSAIINARIEELIMEDRNIKRRREPYQKQSSLLSKLTRQLSIHDNRAAAAFGWSDGSTAECSLRTSGASQGDDWRSALDAASNEPLDSGRYGLNGHSRQYSDPAQDGDERSGSRFGNHRTPTRSPPQQSGSFYRY
ncbi:Dynamin-2A [Hibiscus syriacus]|uniref:Dynamin-2A n=1 Tax=Hibiscus syriacus TaxID=106335 RepID=A0A6A2YUS3_HIBSY|nr:Dynamin-2A [Hibiscus syriacus]